MTPEVEIYKPKNHIRIVTAASLFDGHDAAINIAKISPNSRWLRPCQASSSGNPCQFSGGQTLPGGMENCHNRQVKMTEFLLFWPGWSRLDWPVAEQEVAEAGF